MFKRANGICILYASFSEVQNFILCLSLSQTISFQDKGEGGKIKKVCNFASFLGMRFYIFMVKNSSTIAFMHELTIKHCDFLKI